MKVYIKPWAEALKSAKEFDKRFDKRFVDTIGDIDYIIGISHRHGDWGHIVEAKKDNNSRFDYYTTYYKDKESFAYPACCIEEITPEWLEEHASKFAEEMIVTESASSVWDKDLTNYKIYRVTIYKAMDGLHTYFFYVKRISYNSCEEIVEEFREIK